MLILKFGSSVKLLCVCAAHKTVLTVTKSAGPPSPTASQGTGGFFDLLSSDASNTTTSCLWLKSVLPDRQIPCFTVKQ